MSDSGNSTGSILMAFVVGALAGAAVALLYAPATGEETRRKLATKAREGRDTLAGVVERGRETIAEAVERGREAYEQVRRERV
jgi:gas vesicle protein